jgi:hypothetical protein
VLTALLSTDIQNFIRDHEQDDERQLVLKHTTIFGVPSSIIADQISGRRKAKEKLPTFYHSANIIYPPGINLEQTSSEQTARFKADLLLKLTSSRFSETSHKSSPKEGIDLTGGLGIDTCFLSPLFSSFHYVDTNASLLEIARHNHAQLSLGNIHYHNTSAEDFIDQLNHPVDFIFIDPSRRNQGKKVFSFSDSEPDIATLQPKIFQKTGLLLVKASPLFDIKQGIKELSNVKKVLVLSVENEVKELLFVCEKDFSDESSIESVNLLRDGSSGQFDFLFSQESLLTVEFSDPLTYVYEPNASILKAGAFKTISKTFSIPKIQTSTHLYTSHSLIKDFPGRIYKVEALIKPDPKIVRSFLPDGKANVTTRNYPLSVEELKKKTGLNDGGNKYLLAFSGVKEKFVCVASRIK